MSKYKLNQDEMKDIAHFLTRRNLLESKGDFLKSLTEYLENYNKLMDGLEKYNKSTS